MTLLRWNPARELSNVERELNHFWRSFNSGFSNEKKDSIMSPLTDISEDKDNYYLAVDMPGISKKDLKIKIDDDRLFISGERKSEKENKDETFHRVERSFGKYERSFILPKEVLADKIDANFKDGQLKIVIPKTEKAKPKELDIKIN